MIRLEFSRQLKDRFSGSTTNSNALNPLGSRRMSKLTSGFIGSSRRSFLRGLAATPVAALASEESLLGQAIKAPGRDTAQTSSNTKSKKFVAMQIGARS